MHSMLMTNSTYTKVDESEWLLSRPFFKEFRVVGQICLEGMDEKWYPAESTIYNDYAYFIAWSSWLSGGEL